MSIMKTVEWQDLSDEKFRIYHFPGGNSYRVGRPKKLYAKASGSHRVIAESVDGKKVSHYIPSGWIAISWEVRDGQDPFTF